MKQREIKFRAWLDNQMIYGEPNYIWDMTTESDPKMQYTGLKDKNGKEIYEGDILHTFGGEFEGKPGRETHRENTQVVSYSEEHAGYMGVSHQLWMCHTEVIGNIFENPDLIHKGD